MPSIELVSLVSASLLLISVFSSKLASKVGIPSLLFFLLTGWLIGEFGGPELHSPEIAKFIGDFALIFILFTGGLDSHWPNIRPVLWQGLCLSTLGVFITMLLLGSFAWFILGSFSTFSLGVHGITLTQGLLLAAIVSSTDAAAVFSVLRSSHIVLKGKLQPLLELESSSNDPMAVLLTVTLLNYATGAESAFLEGGMFLVMQLLIGVAVGYGGGRFMVWLLNHMGLSSAGLYAIASIALVLLTYSGATFMHGNGFLAVYVAGIVAGNREVTHHHYINAFHDSFAWLMQIIMFLTLGMLSVPYRAELSSLASVAVAISLFLMFVARPVSVFISLLWAKISFKEKLLVSWVGLRGSVPIVLATFPLAAGIKEAGEIFVLISFIVVMSVLIQGFSLAALARWLGLAEKK
ncbi:potassium/proton antiporter [Methylomonas sp. LW13]|uniref:Potassium/proton antiporter n=1 Tax=Methylomonas defluvii TaxID=3045149 RepID=A0ABU4UH40_9GAMM|nr:MULTISPECIES: potassium/proton antiporter [unclassified Methylomonas]MDX8128634.1 potassium/proton antiporter [Methylomonas sp. OY6]NOV31967.1 potassium/proton antiporter [Methylomonas sp. ZR1]QBC29653.1 potassium/proton antiporter [Methylomonas sp. LW13]